jgi:serine/threonine protein kinase
MQVDQDDAGGIRRFSELVTELSEFEEVGVLGEWTFGRVLKMRRKATGEFCAAKVFELPAGSIRLEQAVVEREVEIFDALYHPAIIRIKGYSPPSAADPAGTIFTEYLEHGSVDVVLRRDPPVLGLTARVKILIGTIHGLRYMHSINIVHGDIQPSNLLLNSQYEVLIAALPSPRAAAIRDTSMTLATGSGGSPYYTAPELLGVYEEPEEITAKADIYAYGILMWAILTGQEPYADTSLHPGRVMMSISKGLRPDAEGLLPYARELISKCWASSPSRRPTADEICEDLRTHKYALIDGIDLAEIENYCDGISRHEQQCPARPIQATPFRNPSRRLNWSLRPLEHFLECLESNRE